jgi:hypothetical protein
MEYLKIIILGLLPLTIIGCTVTPQITNEYTEPEIKPNKNIRQATLNATFEEVWSKVISRLGSQFYDISYIDKESGVINFSFSSDSPNLYLDCGNVQRSFKLESETEFYNFNLAEDHSYKISEEGLSMYLTYFEIFRDLSLTTVGSIHLQARSPEMTSIELDLGFKLDMVAFYKLYTYDPSFNVTNLHRSGRVDDNVPNSLVFNSVDIGYWEDLGATCITTGALENAVIQLAN